ncbi:hypothetical protein HNP55_001401 [Paucibacter oligotrophus]|uniref:Uncharacterized protein n=1 Tax=Roseateles oligotrophus TaxID=1769250 RepID=A0A840L4I7_9BURK|nr:hypothetical protein [Roseateles oligotrophus]MBB4842886.1 hypothetical protein [Roseateles oligotrophus]
MLNKTFLFGLLALAALARIAPAAQAAEAELPPAIAEYRVDFKPAGAPAASPASTLAPQRWYLIRQADSMAILRPDNAEVWRQTAQGISLERIFHAERHIVEYAPGELKTLGLKPSWHSLASGFDAQDLAQLKPGPRHGALQSYAGQLRKEQIRLVWDHALQLPQRLERSGPAGRLLMERQRPAAGRLALASIHAPGWPAGWPASDEALAQYQRLDAADFGDMDYSPVVRKAEAMDIQQGWRRTHAHD